MRSLTHREREVVRWFADRVDEPQRQRLLDDLDHATAEDEVGSLVEFRIDGYDRPPSAVERLVPVDAAVADADGATILVELLEDKNGRLYGLELNRCAPGDVIEPDWTTLRQLRPDEVVDLGVIDLRIRRWGGIDDRSEGGN